MKHRLIPCWMGFVVALTSGLGAARADSGDSEAQDPAAAPAQSQAEAKPESRRPIIPESDTGVGLFYDISSMGRLDDRSPVAVRRHFREMVGAGCNTLTLYVYSVEETAMQMDAAIEEGLVSRFPVFLLACNEDADQVPRQFIQSAKQLSKHAAKWPEIIYYGPDETDGGKQKGISDLAKRIHEQGMRLGLTTWAPLDYAGIADILVPHHTGCTEQIRSGVREAGSVFWAYSVGPFHYSTNYHLPRFIAGVWRWKVRPEVWLAWSYMDCRGDTPVMRGLRDGCMDYRLLRALEDALAKKDHPEARAWLEKLRADIPWNPEADIPARAPRYARPYLGSKTGVPKMANFELYRQWAGYYLSELTGCDQVW